ncbi:CopG family ribbon-helix-helix protein [Metallosphaera tengchongensis]|uniref:CopG family ribbon-helix-helix protein n=1 Tax=Metallosphaera tengchongensis TaxID=1532350 RepID=A0A6N0NX05_9CREN|nr:CopG family ribbon-helix-helix protein [Metallosphaera tengchongensis]QKQ99640.1 CopG family ribbon-helix-helix protein [Metallosphaera tengchongensis]
MNVEKISVAIDKNLLRRLENEANRIGTNRSRIVQQALTDYLGENAPHNAEVIGILNLVYDEDAGNEIISIQHRFESEVISSMHIHVNDKICMEAVAVKGRRADLEQLAKALSGAKGVKKVKLSVSLEVQ